MILLIFLFLSEKGLRKERLTKDSVRGSSPTVREGFNQSRATLTELSELLQVVRH
jgi:hypothetical protein